MEKFLNLAKRNVNRLSAIIRDLLDISKIEAGKMEFRFERTNINLPVELVKNALDNLAKDRNITISIDLAKDLEMAGKILTAATSSELEKHQSEEFIKKNHAAAMKLYDALAEEAKNLAETL